MKPGLTAIGRNYRLFCLLEFGICAAIFVGDSVLMRVQEALCGNAGFITNRSWSDLTFYPLVCFAIWLIIFGLLWITRRMKSVAVDGWYLLIAGMAGWIGFESAREISIPRAVIPECDPSSWSHHNELAQALNVLVMMPIALISIIVILFITFHGLDEYGEAPE